MLRFEAYENGSPAGQVNLSGAYLFGQDQIPVRADLSADGSQIHCAKRAPGAAGLCLLCNAGASGRILMPTTRLPERSRPYNLNLELARARMMLIMRKREDWGLADYPAADPLGQEFDRVRGIFVEAIKAEPDDPGVCARLADECLAQGIDLSERMALFHAQALLRRRRNGQHGSFGCRVDAFAHAEPYYERLRDAFDMVCLPLPWKQIEPKERQIQVQPIDAWTDWCLQQRVPIMAGPLISFEPQFTPDWLYIWEHDYETLRDMLYEHVQRMVTRYAKRVRTWNVVSGLHAYNSFNLSFEQIMELTRMSCLLVKKLSPKATALVDVVLPWGEYYARNPRTVPPSMYADMCVQNGVKFDAFGLQIYMGAAEDGMYVRDLLQISDVLDAFGGLGKPLHVTACQVPSDMAPDRADHWQGQAHSEQAGVWRRPWDPSAQADWLEAVCSMALSKPYVETVTWRDLADHDGHFLPHGGLCRRDLTPKPAYERLRRLRAAMNHSSRAERQPRRAARDATKEAP